MKVSLARKRANALKADWCELLPSELADSLHSVRILWKSRWGLRGVLFIRMPDPDRTGKTLRDQISFKLIARWQFWNRSAPYIIPHFVSQFQPRRLRKIWMMPFLSLMTAWLQTLGYSEVHFPVHSRRRCEAFRDRLVSMGYEPKVHYRILYRLLVVPLAKPDSQE